MNALSPAVTPSGPPLAAPDVARLLKNSLDRIEEVPDYNERHADVLALLDDVRPQVAVAAVGRVLDLAKAGVDDRDTVYNALQVGRLAEHAIASGQFGTFPQAAALTHAIIDVLRYAPKEHAARRLVGLLAEQCDDPSARQALDLCGRIKDGGWWSSGDGVSKVALHTLEAIAAGFDGSARQVVDLGLGLCQDVHGRPSRGSTFQPVIETLCTGSDPGRAAAYRFLGDLTFYMDGASAARFLQSEVSLAPAAFARAGDDEKLRLASAALEGFTDAERLAEASGLLLESIGKALGEPGHQRVLALARSLHEALTHREGEKSSPDTSGLLSVALEMARSNEDVGSDREVLEAAGRMLHAMGTTWSGQEKQVLAWLQASLGDERARAAVSFVDRIAKAPGVPGPAFKSLDLAKRALDGEPLDIIGWGREIIATMHPAHEASGYREMLAALREDPARADQVRLIDLALSAFGTFGPTEDAPRLAEMVLAEIVAGTRDADTDPLDVVRRMSNALPSAQERARLIESSGPVLLEQTGHPEAARFLSLALELTRGSCDPSHATTIFEKVLDKAEALRDGQPFHLVDDSLEIINSVPDRLFQASALRQLMLKLAQQQVGQGVFSSALERPLETMSCTPETSTERLQRNVDLLNLLLASARDGCGTWGTLARLYEATPEAERDVMAVSVFRDLCPDSTKRNLDRFRGSNLSPADWKVLADTIRGAETTPHVVSLVRDGLRAIDAHSDDAGSRAFPGAVAFVLLQEVERRAGRRPGIAAVLEGLRKTVGESGAVSHEVVEGALLDAVRGLLREVPADRPATLETVQAQSLVMQMDHRWKEGDVAANRKTLLQTLDDLDKNAAGAHVTLDEWILRGAEERPAPKVVEEGDYVVVGGVVIPKRKG